MHARDRIAFAADLPLEEALAMYAQVAPHVGVAKVGLSLFVEHGPAAVRRFRDLGAEVFLDLKLHDIPNTVELAAARAGGLGVSYLTVHASGGMAMMRAALKGAGEGAAKAGLAAPVVLAVTVLTSMGEADLRQTGVPDSPAEQAHRLAVVAKASGVIGLVCSAREISGVRAVMGPGAVLCTPGIRPLGVAANDQARVETPAAAILAGATLLVVGRPISADPSPREAAARIEAEVRQALGG